MKTSYSTTLKILLFIFPLWLSACAHYPPREPQHTLHQQDGQVYYSTSSSPFDALNLWRLDTQTRQAQHLHHFVDPAKIGQSLDRPLWFKSHLYFWRTLVGGGRDAELWRTDGTTTGTQHIFTVPSPNGEYLNSPELVAFADRLYLFAMDGAEIPSTVWQTDGSMQEERLVMRNPNSLFAGKNWGSTWSFPGNGKPILIHNGKLIFITYKQGTRERLNLWSIDAAQPGKAVLLGEFGHIAIHPPANGDNPALLFFRDGETRWQTDGTRVGTRR